MSENESLPNLNSGEEFSVRETLFHLFRQVANPKLSDEERGSIMTRLIELQQPENLSQAFLAMLRDALNTKNKEELSFVLDALQKRMEEHGSLKTSGLSDIELDSLVASKEGMVSLGSGTKGCRIYIRNGELIMSRDELHGLEYQEAFRKFFGLKSGDDFRIAF